MANLQKGEALYFIALVPPEPLKSELWQQKEAMHKRYESKASLNSPAHITLHMPFRLKEKREAELEEALARVGNAHAPFPLELKGYDAFKPRVLFVNVINTDPLRSLQKAVHQCLKTGFYTFNADYKQKGFHPHITLAFRDLKKAKFQEAWREFEKKEFQAGWEVTAFTLLKHNGKKWEEHQQIPLSPAEM